MRNQSETVMVRLTSGVPSSTVVETFRSYCSLPVADVVRGIKSKEPIVVGVLFGLDHDAQLHQVRNLVRELGQKQIAFEVILGGVPTSHSDFEHAIATWNQIESEVAADLERELGGFRSRKK